jgi:hypothetical protein
MNDGIKNTIDFIDQLEILAKTVDENGLVSDSVGEYNAKEYLTSIVYEARDLLKYNEWIIALEISLDNLYEVNYQLDDESIDFAKNALISASKYNEWAIALEEMRMNP